MLPSRKAIGLLLVCLTFPACTATYPSEPTKAEPIALRIQYALPQGRIGTATHASSRYEFVAMTIDRDGAFEMVTDRANWISSNERVARLSGSGGQRALFLPVEPGTANAIVRFAGMEVSAPMVVVESALLDSYPRLDLVSPGTSPRAFLRQGSSTSQVLNVTNVASWSSSDTGVATVSAAGAVTGVGFGTTVITATFEGLTDWYWLSFGPQFP
jgi:hypothetical protein